MHGISLQNVYRGTSILPSTYNSIYFSVRVKSCLTFRPYPFWVYTIDVTREKTFYAKMYHLVLLLHRTIIYIYVHMNYVSIRDQCGWKSRRLYTNAWDSRNQERGWIKDWSSGCFTSPRLVFTSLLLSADSASTSGKILSKIITSSISIGPNPLP